MNPEQEAFLGHDQFVDEVLRRREERKPEAAPVPAAKENAWLTFLQSSSGTALITVLLGTLGGGIITDLVQEREKQKEAHSLKVSAYLKNQQEIYTDAFALLGKAVADSEDMATITEAPFYTGTNDGLSRADEATIDTQKSAIVDAFNSVDAEWRRRRTTLSLLIRLYNQNDQGVATSWDATSSALTAFMNCERDFNIQQNRLHIVSTTQQSLHACETPQRRQLEAAESNLIQAVTAAQARAL